MTFEDLNTLLDYNYWARDRLLAAVEPLTQEQFLRPMGNSFTSVRDTLVHLIAAEVVWISRWHGESPTAFIPNERYTCLADIRAEWASIEAEVREFLRTVGPDGITRVFEFKLFNGQPSTSIFWHMLQHVVNHSTYHRGQVTTMLRQLGAPPAKSMDLITFYRERG